MDQGDGKSDLIAIETIDRGMRPEGAAALFIDKDECLRPRRSTPGPWRGRLRAPKCGQKRRHAAAVRRNRQPHHKAIPPAPGLSADRDLVIGQAVIYQEALDFRVDGDPPTMALKWLSELECEVSNRLLRRAKAKNPPHKAGWSWEKLLRDEFGKKAGSKLPPEVEDRARKEKAEALAKLCERRFSVLYGRGRDRKDISAEGFSQGPRRTRRQKALPAPGSDRQGPRAADGPNKTGRRHCTGRLHDPPVLDAAQLVQP